MKISQRFKVKINTATVVQIAVLTAYGCLVLSGVAGAETKPPQAGTETLNQIKTNATGLGQTLSGVVSGLATASTVGKVGWHMWMKSMADGDQSSVQDHNKRMKNTVIWGGGIAALTAILYAVVGAMSDGIAEVQVPAASSGK